MIHIGRNQCRTQRMLDAVREHMRNVERKVAGRKVTSRECLLQAINHQEPDHVPCSPRMFNWMSGIYGDDGWICQMRLANEFGFDPLVRVFLADLNVVAEPDNPVIDAVQYLSDISVDITTKRHADYTEVRRTFHTPAGDISEEKIMGDPGSLYGDRPDPLFREHLLKGPEDLEPMKFLLPDFDERKAEILPTIIELVGERGLVEVSPRHGAGGYPLATFLGAEQAMLLAYDDPDFLRQCLQLFNEYYQSSARACLKHGAPMLVDAWWTLSVGSGWSPQLFREFAMPPIRENIELVHSYGAFYHYYDDGALDKTVDWIAQAGADIIETLAPPPLGDIDLAEVKKRIGDRSCLKGNIDQVNLIWRGNPEQIREAVRQAIAAAAPGGGYILSTADSIRSESPPENIQAFFDAWREFGSY